MKIKQIEKKIVLEMNSIDEFLSFFLLVSDGIPHILGDLGAYGLISPLRVKKDLEQLNREAVKQVQLIPLEQRQSKLFKSS